MREKKQGKNFLKQKILTRKKELYLVRFSRENFFPRGQRKIILKFYNSGYFTDNQQNSISEKNFHKEFYWITKNFFSFSLVLISENNKTILIQVLINVLSFFFYLMLILLLKIPDWILTHTKGKEIRRISTKSISSES